MADDIFDHKEDAEQATYEDESAKASRTVTIPLKEYDEINGRRILLKVKL